MRKPDCIFIGYQKSGTTFLRHFFTQHPGIEWCRHAFFFREPGDDQSRSKYLREVEAECPGAPCLIDMYEGLGAGHIGDFIRDGENIRYEAGAPLKAPAVRVDHARIAQNVADTLGNVKILMTIREPVSWLRSNYLHFHQSLPPARNRFTDFLNTPEGKCLLAAARFDTTIGTYANLFGATNVHVLPLEALKADRETALNRLCDFLSVRHHRFVPSAEARNRGAGGLPSRGLAWLNAHPSLFNLAKKIYTTLPRFPKSLEQSMRSKEFISEEVAEALRGAFAASNMRTAELTGIDLERYGYTI